VTENCCVLVKDVKLFETAHQREISRLAGLGSKYVSFERYLPAALFPIGKVAQRRFKGIK
jgi:hypothetical protein